MDAIVVQVAEEFHATLVTLDEEMIKRAKCIVNINYSFAVKIGLS
jgi:hypothetical protein